MHHPNLQCASASENLNIGSVRENFFINKLEVLESMKYTSEGDFAFEVDVFKIEGCGETNKQVKHLSNSYVIPDDIEVGHLHKIPLWIFGFFY